MSEGRYRTPLDLFTTTDIHALRRVRRLCDRILVEAEHHDGHDPSCPWADQRMIASVLFLVEECDRMAASYEKRHGTVPIYPFTQMTRREDAPPEA